MFEKDFSLRGSYCWVALQSSEPPAVLLLDSICSVSEPEGCLNLYFFTTVTPTIACSVKYYSPQLTIVNKLIHKLCYTKTILAAQILHTIGRTVFFAINKLFFIIYLF